MTSRIAIVGAGLAGLVLARELNTHHDVTLFEKARGVGGRMATRYADDYRFDHGAQFFTARSRRFRDFLAPFMKAGDVAVWHARFAEFTGDAVTATREWNDEHPHYVGTPGMNALPKALADGLDVRLNTQVARVEHRNGGWHLHGDAGRIFEADQLIVTAPLPQTIELLGDEISVPVLADKRAMKACFAVMLGFPETVATTFDAARVLSADISWMSVNASKPGRSDAFTMVVHATNAWADANVDMDIEEAQRHLLAEFERVSGIDASKADHIRTHRWRYANTDRQLDPDCYFDADRRLGICGDWMIRGRVEAAFRSASSLLDRIL